MNGKEYLQAIGANTMSQIQLAHVIADLVEDNNALSKYIDKVELKNKHNSLDYKLGSSFNKEVELRKIIQHSDLPADLVYSGMNFDFVPQEISRAIALELIEEENKKPFFKRLLDMIIGG